MKIAWSDFLRKTFSSHTQVSLRLFAFPPSVFFSRTIVSVSCEHTSVCILSLRTHASSLDFFFLLLLRELLQKRR